MKSQKNRQSPNKPRKKSTRPEKDTLRSPFIRPFYSLLSPIWRTSTLCINILSFGLLTFSRRPSKNLRDRMTCLPVLEICVIISPTRYIVMSVDRFLKKINFFSPLFCVAISLCTGMKSRPTISDFSSLEVSVWTTLTRNRPNGYRSNHGTNFVGWMKSRNLVVLEIVSRR